MERSIQLSHFDDYDLLSTYFCDCEDIMISWVEGDASQRVAEVLHGGGAELGDG